MSSTKQWVQALIPGLTLGLALGAQAIAGPDSSEAPTGKEAASSPRAPLQGVVADTGQRVWSASVEGVSLICSRAGGDARLVAAIGSSASPRTLSAERISPVLFGDQPGVDLDGDGARELVFSAWEGRRCRLWVAGPSGLRRVPGWHAPGARFVDLDRDGRLELITLDETFRGFDGASEADSVAVQVVLARSARGWLWSAAPELSGRLRPDPRSLRRHARSLAPRVRVRAAQPARSARATSLAASAPNTSDLPAWRQRLTGALLDLYVGGHGALAPAFLAAAWPKDTPGRAAYWRSFHDRIVKSPYLAVRCTKRCRH